MLKFLFKLACSTTSVVGVFFFKTCYNNSPKGSRYFNNYKLKLKFLHNGSWNRTGLRNISFWDKGRGKDSSLFSKENWATREISSYLSVNASLHKHLTSSLIHHLAPLFVLFCNTDVHVEFLRQLSGEEKFLYLFCLFMHGSRHETFRHARMDMPLCLIFVCV